MHSEPCEEVKHPIRLGEIHVGFEVFLCDEHSIGFDEKGLQVVADRHNAFEPGGAVERLVKQVTQTYWFTYQHADTGNHKATCDYCKSITELEELLTKKEEG